MASCTLLDEQVCDLLDRAEKRLQHNAAADSQPLSSVDPPAASINPSHGMTNGNPYIRTMDGLAIPVDSEQAHRTPKDVKVIKRKNETTNKDKRWHHVPRTDPNKGYKRDLQLLKMRGVLDPKRHYKKEGSHKAVPKYSQVGTVIQGSTEYSTARIPLKKRKQTFLAEILAQEAEQGRFTRKYQDIQGAKSSGKTAHYKRLKAKR